MKTELKQRALLLRQQGYSYGYINELLPVSKSTLSEWLSKVPYRPNRVVVKRIGKARAAAGAAKSHLKRESFEKARVEAKIDVGTLTRRDLFMVGLGVYMGEGTKGHGIVRVINADPKIIKLAIRWFTEICGLPLQNFKIRLHVYPDTNVLEALKYWSKMSNIPLKQFHPVSVDRREGKKLFKRGKLPFGTAHLSVQSRGKKEFGVFLSRKINAWISEASR